MKGGIRLVMTLRKAGRIIISSLTPARPYHVQWFISRRCNYRCRGCDVWREQDDKELSTNEIKRGLDILRDLGVIEVVLSGGNPLLRQDIGEIIEYAARSFITTVYDNGSMAAEKIDDLRSADLVAISIDSLDPVKNDYVRGVKGAWQKSMDAVEKLHEEGISVCVSPTISQYNLYEILDLTKHFVEKDIPVWYCLYSYDPSASHSNLFKIGKKQDEFAIVDERAMVNLCNSLIYLEKKNNNVLMTTETLRAIRQLYSTGQRIWKCRALQNFFAIDHYGRVSGCHLHNPIASIFDLPALWTSQKLDVLRSRYSRCARCTYLCYIFYSIHGSVLGNLQIAREQWKNTKLVLRRTR